MKHLKYKLIQYLVRNLLVAVSEDDILTITNKGWFTNRRKLTPEEIDQLREDAQGFRDSNLWHHMRNEIRYQANLRMFEKGIDAEHTIFGRAMLYDLQIIESFMNNCKKL